LKLKHLRQSSTQDVLQVLKTVHFRRNPLIVDHQSCKTMIVSIPEFETETAIRSGSQKRRASQVANSSSNGTLQFSMARNRILLILEEGGHSKSISKGLLKYRDPRGSIKKIMIQSTKKAIYCVSSQCFLLKMKLLIL